MMPPLDTARRLIRSLSTNRSGTNSANHGPGEDEFLGGSAFELQHLPLHSSTSTPASSRPASPIATTIDEEADPSPLPVDHPFSRFPDSGPAVLRFRARAITRADSFDSTSSACSRSSSRSSRSSTLSSCGDAVAHTKRPAKKRRESQTCWREYWD